MTRPLVAIVGRPNVGKSALFNRLVGKLQAIVEDIPGTTRDRVYADISWGDREFTLVDTGGLEIEPETDMAKKVKEQVEMALAEAEAIVFVVDVVDGVTHPDLEIAEMLRRSAKPVFLAVNKADNDKRRAEAFQFHELGIGEPFPISAYHGTGVAELMDQVLAVLPPTPPLQEEPALLKVAIVGRPNVGKSMLLNAILGQERVIVDDMPGTTRDAVDTTFRYEGEPVLLIDTAGIRRRGRIEQGVERYSVLRAVRAINRADVAVLVSDAQEVVAAQDTHIAGYIREAGKGMVFVVNKWDLATEMGISEEASTESIRERLKFFPEFPILYVSAKLRQEVDKVLAAAKQVYQARQMRVPTPLLNNVVNQAVSAHSPPSVRGKRLNILYVTQTDVNPPTFVFFVNDPKLLNFSYRRYLENRLRDHFGFAGTPLRLIFRPREKQ